MGKIFLYLWLSIGGEMYGPEVHMFQTEAACQDALLTARRDAIVLQSFAHQRSLDFRAVAECLSTDDLQKRGIKSA